MAALDQAEAEAALENRGHPQRQAIAGERAARGGRGHQPEGRLAGDDREGLADSRHLPAADWAGRGRSRTKISMIGASNSPATPITRKAARQSIHGRDVGADQRARRQAERDAEREDGQRPGPSVRREIIGDQRVGGRHAAGFADTDAQPEEEQLAEAGGGAAQRGEGAPHGNRAGDHPAAAGAVGQHRQWHAEHRVENGEGNSADRPELGIGQLEIGDDRTGEDAEDLPVEEIEDVGEQQQGENDIGPRAMGPLPCCSLIRSSLSADCLRSRHRSQELRRWRQPPAGSVSIGAWPTPGTSTRCICGRHSLHPVGDCRWR